MFVCAAYTMAVEIAKGCNMLRDLFRDGCVLSPRLLYSIFEWALSKWRAQCNGSVFDFQDGGVSLLDLRFADDILIVGGDRSGIGHVGGCPPRSWSCSQRWKTKILTMQSQHPAELISPDGISVEILARNRAHKWLGGMMGSHTGGSHGLHLEHHRQDAPMAIKRAVFGRER